MIERIAKPASPARSAGSLSAVISSLGLFACVSLGACTTYDDTLVGGKNPSDASTTCVLAKWPKPPSGTNLGGGNDFVVALRAFDFGETFTGDDGVTNRERPVGYDLDNKCTRDTETTDPSLTDDNSCRRVADWVDPLYGDLPGGRDNGLRHVIEFVAKYFTGFGTPSYNAAIDTGEVSLLMQVQDYNGQPDDDAVRFTLYTPGRFSQNNAAPPKFQGNDEWPISSISYEGGDSNKPKFISQAAWVTNGTLVASFPNVDFRLKIGIAQVGSVDLVLKFLEPFFTAKIEKDPNGVWWLRQGRIAAKWKTQDLFAQVKYFLNPFHQAAPDTSYNECLNTPGYNLVHNAICQSVDIYSGGIAPATICDAISVGIGFDAVQAKLGPTVEPDPLQSDCGAFDPARDDCTEGWDKKVAHGILNPPDGG